MNELRINWTGSPLFNLKYYLIKANSTDIKLANLQSMTGVFDMPNIDSDKLANLPQARITKNRAIAKLLGITINEQITVLDFIHQIARSEGNFAWDKNSLVVPDEE